MGHLSSISPICGQTETGTGVSSEHPTVAEELRQMSRFTPRWSVASGHRSAVGCSGPLRPRTPLVALHSLGRPGPSGSVGVNRRETVRQIRGPPGTVRWVRGPPGTVRRIGGPPGTARWVRNRPGTVRWVRGPQGTVRRIGGPPGTVRRIRGPPGTVRWVRGHHRRLPNRAGNVRLRGARLLRLHQMGSTAFIGAACGSRSRELGD